MVSTEFQCFQQIQWIYGFHPKRPDVLNEFNGIANDLNEFYEIAEISQQF